MKSKYQEKRLNKIKSKNIKRKKELNKYVQSKKDI